MPDYGLSPQQLAVICALSTGAAINDAAAQAGIHRNTINNWRRNFLPFQQALADAQYDRALLFREKIEELVDLAVETIHGLLADPDTPPSVRLKAALAILQTASTPPAPKKQVEIEIQKIVVTKPDASVHNSAQPPADKPDAPNDAPNDAPGDAQNAHNPAQTVRRESLKIGRNDPCPCGSGVKFKRCCIDKHPEPAQCRTFAP